METYYRRRLRSKSSGNNEMIKLKMQEKSSFAAQIPPLARQLLQPDGLTEDRAEGGEIMSDKLHFFRQTDDYGMGEKHLEVGSVYEIDHLNLPTRTPVQLRSIRVVMVTEKTELNVSVRYPSIGSLCSYLSNTKMSSMDIYPFLDEMFVMGTQLAGKVLCRNISAQEFDDNNHFEGFWLLKNSPAAPVAENEILNKGTATPLMSQLKSTGMVRWGIRRQVKFLNRHGENSNSHPQSSSSFVKGSEEKLDKEQLDEDNDVDNHEEEEEDEDNEVDDEEGEREETDEDNKQNVKRKRYSFRDNTRKAKKVKREMQKQNYKKTKNKCRKMVVASSINRWSAERYKLAERNLLEVMKAKGAVFNKPILRPDLRMEARKRIGDTGLLDHLLKHVSGKLAPGGTERFRRRHNADGAMEYWLESADLVKVRREAGVQDPYWTPPPGWTPGDSPSQDPICAKELKLLKGENAKLRRDMEEMMLGFKEELHNLRRELDEQFTKKLQEKSATFQVSSPGAICQKLNQDTSLMAPWKSDFESILVQVNKQKKQLTGISEALAGMKEQLGKPNSMVDLASKTKDYYAEKEKNQAASEKTRAGAAQGKEVVSGAPKTAADEKAARLQKLKSGFRICKPQGTFLWPNMGASSNNNSNMSSQVVVQVEDLFTVPTPPSVSSSTASAPPPLPYHHYPPTSPIRPVPERRAVTVTVSTARPYNQDANNDYSTTTTTIAAPKNKNNISLINLNDIPDPDEGVSVTPVIATTATKPHLQPSSVKTESVSAWDVGSGRGTNKSSFVAKHMVNAKGNNQQV